MRDGYFDSVQETIEDIRAGKCIVVSDDEGRENEGDLICAAELITPETINFMASEARGYICLSLTAEKARNHQEKTNGKVMAGHKTYGDK